MKKTVLAVLAAMTALTLFGWGSGHSDHAGLVLKYLPEEISSVWSDAAKKQFQGYWSHYPDSHAAIEKKVQELIGPDAFRFLNEIQIRTHYGFHSDTGKGAAFFLLAKAFREKNYDAAAFFAGVLMHGLADANAFNHGPLIHHLTYTRYRHIRYPKADLDLSLMRSNQKLAEKIGQRLSGFRPDAGGKELRKAVIELMLEEIDSNAYMCARENKLAVAGPDGNISDAALDAMADIAAYQTKIGANAICAAWRLADSKEPLDLKPADLNAKAFAKLSKAEKAGSIRPEYDRLKSVKWERRDPRTDSIYAGLFDKNSRGGKRIGLICEATYAMNHAFLGFGSKFIIGTVGRSLLKSGQAVEAIPMFDLKKTVPSPKAIPVIMICTNNGAPGFVVNALKKYISQGGKIIVIGGRQDMNLTGLAPFFERRKNNEIPVSSAYGKANQDIIGGMKVCPAGLFADAFTPREFAFKDNPNTPAGWNKPFSNIAIKAADPAVIPLFELDNGKERFCIAAARKDGKGGIVSVWLPQYLLMPFLFSEDAAMPDWSKPELDSFGCRVVSEVLKQLN